MPSTVTTVLVMVGSSATERMVWTTVSFCMSSISTLSAKNSTNSHKTPIVIEKQNATMDTKIGERLNIVRSERLRRSTMEKPIAAARKPFIVCSMVSQKLKRT